MYIINKKYNICNKIEYKMNNLSWCINSRKKAKNVEKHRKTKINNIIGLILKCISLLRWYHRLCSSETQLQKEQNF